MDRPQRLAARQERRSAAFYGARLTPASGSLDSKGDAYTDTELFEFKHTERRSYSLKPGEFARLATWALIARKRPVLEVEFTTPEGRNIGHLVVLDRDDYLAMRGELAELRMHHCPGCEC